MHHNASQEANTKQLFRKLPSFHELGMFITTFTGAHQLALYCARLILFIPPPLPSLLL